MFVGGEFYYDDRFQVEKPVISTDDQVFLNGGKACLTVISAFLHDHGIQEIMLPSYICPTVLDTLESCGMRISFYQVNRGFEIDLEDLSAKASRKSAVYFVNYFGFPLRSVEIDFMIGLKQSGVLLVEDNAQAGFWRARIGHFAFNSMRKLCPYDGGYLSADVDVTPYLDLYQGTPNRRLPLIRAYRRELADYLLRGAGDHSKLVELYEQAEAIYATDHVVEGDPAEKWGIEHLDWVAIRQQRRQNYTDLLELIKGIPGITPVFSSLPPEAVPLGLPVYLEGLSRDWLLDEMGEAGIGLTVHWEEILADSRLNNDPIAVDMASRMLTLCIDQRVDRVGLNYQANQLAKIVRWNKKNF